MRRRGGSRNVRWLGFAGLLGAGFAALGGPASGVSAADGRLELHGYYELQVRAIARDFDASDDWDVTQLAHVLDLELELLAERAPLFDAASLFARIEVRYDCVGSHACGLFPSVNAFGNGSKKLPKRLNDGRRDGFVGNVVTGDRRHYRGEPSRPSDCPTACVPTTPGGPTASTAPTPSPPSSPRRVRTRCWAPRTIRLPSSSRATSAAGAASSRAAPPAASPTDRVSRTSARSTRTARWSRSRPSPTAF